MIRLKDLPKHMQKIVKLQDQARHGRSPRRPAPKPAEHPQNRGLSIVCDPQGGVTIHWAKTLTIGDNKHHHPMKRARLTKIERTYACMLVKSMAGKLPPLPLAIHCIRLVPNLSGTDEHNVKSACKAIIDGIGDAYGVNDSQFKVTEAKAHGQSGAIIHITTQGGAQ
jgi:hypothetical protein